MPNQVDGAFVHAPCPVPSCPACEPNFGSVPRAYQPKPPESRGADIVMQSSSGLVPISPVTAFIGTYRDWRCKTDTSPSGDASVAALPLSD